MRSLLICGLLFVTCIASLTSAPAARGQTFDDEIVYMDASGVIRVLDTHEVSRRNRVTWYSPVGGFAAFALADVNSDGDMEIFGLREEGEIAQLVIYDPVIASGVFDPDLTINGIPWTTLYEAALPGKPRLVGAGELDVNAPGVELLYSFEVNESTPGGGTATRQRFRLMRSTGAHDGRSWEESDLPLAGDRWSSLAIGDMDANGPDEVALVSRADRSLQIYRLLANGVEVLFSNQSSSRPWRHLAMGRWVANSRLRLAAVRDGPLGLPSLFVVRYSLENRDIREDYTEAFDPSPDFTFFADVNGNGDDELFMIRSVPGTIPNRARLFMRKNPNSTGTTIAFEDVLDADNGYKAGAGGDIDGDGKDEVAVIRLGKLRYYAAPDANTTPTEESINTDGLHIAMGDLDRNGYLKELRIATSPSSIGGTARSGEATSPPSLLVTNGVNTEPLPFSWMLDGNPTWVTVSATGDRTPATLTFRFDASNLPEGTYSTVLLISSNHPLVFQQPPGVELRFTVTAGLFAAPSSLAFIQYPCVEPHGIQSQATQIQAQSGLSYTVSLLQIGADALATVAAPDESHIVWPSSVPWASAFSERGVAPESLTVSVDFTKLGNTAGRAQGVIAATIDGEAVVRVLDISALCADHRHFLPVIQQGQ